METIVVKVKLHPIKTQTPKALKPTIYLFKREVNNANRFNIYDFSGYPTRIGVLFFRFELDVHLYVRHMPVWLEA
jgi:hypothetical protein